MGVPRAHSTRGQKGRRRSHLRLALPRLLNCGHCSKPRNAHTTCKHCGYYGSREIINVLAQELKKKQKQSPAN